MKILFIIFVLVFSTSTSFKVFADESAIQNAPFDIIRTLAKKTNTFTTENGEAIKIGSTDFERIILQKLKDEPEFRQQFLNETLQMHEQLLAQLKTDMTESLTSHTNYRKFSHRKSTELNGTRMNLQYSIKLPYSNLFEELNLLKLMIASTAFSSSSKEQSTFRAKIVREMALSQSYLFDINELQREIIRNETRAELSDLRGDKMSDADFEKHVQKVSAESFKEQRVTTTLLQFELSQIPMTQANIFDLIFDAKDPKKLEYSKSMVLERIKVISLSMYAHLFPVEVQKSFVDGIQVAEKSTTKSFKDITEDARVSFALNNVTERIKATLAKPTLYTNFKGSHACSKNFE